MKKRGQQNSDRQKELVKRAIKKHGKDVITEYNIIQSDGNKKVKIPIKFLDQYKFTYGKLTNQKGTGHGHDLEVGKKVRFKGEKKGKGQSGSGKPGDKSADMIFEAEISVDELVDVMLEELNLPWMKPNNSSVISTKKQELTSISKKGIMSNLDLKRTVIQNIKRNAAKGKAKVGGFVDDDFRYKRWEDKFEYHSKAAVYMMMDRSGSMTNEHKHVAKSFFFWMSQFLKRRYKNIELHFIAHDTRAQMVTEEEFFSVTSAGGTMCSSAFKAALEHIKANNPPSECNNYVFEFSDGDNWGEDNNLCVEIVEELLPLCSAIGYGEIMLKNRRSWRTGSFGLLSDKFREEIHRTRFLSYSLSGREDVFDCLKKFFNVEGSNNKNTRKD